MCKGYITQTIRLIIWPITVVILLGLVLPFNWAYGDDTNAENPDSGDTALVQQLDATDFPQEVRENIPADILVKRDDGTVDTITYIEALINHEANEQHEDGVNHEEEISHICFGVTSVYLAIQYAVAELFGDEIPESDDIEIFIAGRLQGALDTLEMFLGEPAMMGKLPLGPDAFTITAIRRSTRERIVFGYDPVVLGSEFEDFLTLKKAGRRCEDPELAQTMNALAGKVLAAGPSSCFVPIHEGGTSGSAVKPGFLVIAHGFNKAWDDTVCRALSELTSDEDELYEVCFLEDFTAHGEGYIPPQQAYEALLRRGATEIVGIPLFIDSNSSHIAETRYVFGLEEMDDPEEELLEILIIPGEVPIAGLTPAIDGHPLVGEAFARMILEADDPEKGNRVILVAHGPSSDVEEATWIINLGSAFDVLVSELPADFFIEYNLMTLRVMDFPYFKDRLEELGAKLKDFTGEGEVFLLYFHISPGYLDMIVQGSPPGSMASMMFPGCLDELTTDELDNIVHLTQGFCGMGILPGIVQDRAGSGYMVKERWIERTGRFQ